MKKLLIALTACTVIAMITILSACGATYLPLPQDETLQQALQGYEVVFEDDFDGDTLDPTKWTRGYNESVRRAGYYEATDDTLFVKDGNLTIRTLYKNGQFGEGWYTSWVDSSPSQKHAPATGEDYQGFAAQYGYFEIRCIVPPCEGIWSAFWLMPEGGTGMTNQDELGTGHDGVEIDVMESPYYVNRKQQNLNVHVLHGDGYGDNLRSDRSPSYIVPDMYTQFHTYGVMWTDTEYIFYIDGRETWRSQHTVDGVTLGVSQVPEYLLMTVEIGGENYDGVLYPGKTKNPDGTWSDFWCGNPDNNDKTKVYDFVIDYVRVWQKA